MWIKLYFKNDEKIVAKNKTKVFIDSKYEFISKNVIFSQPQAELSSNYKTKIIENSKQLLEFEKFTFNIEKELLKAENITYNDNIQNSKELSNNLFFRFNGNPITSTDIFSFLFKSKI